MWLSGFSMRMGMGKSQVAKNPRLPDNSAYNEKASVW
jgi:hypothetical protein